MSIKDRKFWNSSSKHRELAKEIDMSICWYYPEPHDDMYWDRTTERVAIGGRRSDSWRQQ